MWTTATPGIDTNTNIDNSFPRGRTLPAESSVNI